MIALAIVLILACPWPAKKHHFPNQWTPTTFENRWHGLPKHPTLIRKQR